MPTLLTPADFRRLRAHLNDELGDCDLNLDITKAWLKKCGFSVEENLAVLRHHCGFCDCEVLANVPENAFGTE